MSTKPPPSIYADGLPFTSEGRLAAERGPVAYFHQGFAFTASHSLAIDSGDDPEYVAPHTHIIDDVIELRETLDAKALASHVHPISDVEGLQPALDGKANTSHAHPISDVTGLQAALDAKANASHTHTITSVTGLQAALDGKQAALGFTPENTANRGQANGYAPLDSTGKVAAAFLPSFVDDVIEAETAAGFPSPGESGKMYVALDTGRIHRWGGSGYVEISGSPGSTDAVPEGAVNLYFTDARARAAVTGAASTLTSTNLTTSRALVSNTSGKVAVSAVTSTELGHLTGATSAIQTQLNGKANTSHTHAIAEVTGLQAALDAKANASHVHVIGDVTGLQAALDGKAAASHTHTIAQITNLQTALDEKALASDPRLIDAREWTAATVDQAEAEAGTATTRRAWTSQRVRQAVLAWWQSATTTVGRALAALTDPGAVAFIRLNADNTATARSAAEMRGDLGLGTAATATLTTSNVSTTAGHVIKVGDYGQGVGPAFVNVDLNTLTTPGIYAADSAASVNTPTSGAFVVHVSSGSSGGNNTRVVQVATNILSGGTLGRMYTRAGRDGITWSTWAEVYNSVNQLALGTTAAAGRTALGLGTAATANVTTSAADSTAGRVSRVGDFGIGGDSLTLGTASLNDDRQTGFYYAQGVTTDKPIGTAGPVIQVRQGPSTSAQLYLAVEEDRILYRRKLGGVFQSWLNLYHSGNTLNIGASPDGARTALGLGTAATATLATGALDATAGRAAIVGGHGIGSGAVHVADVTATEVNVARVFRIIDTTVGAPSGLLTPLGVISLPANGTLNTGFLAAGSDRAFTGFKSSATGAVQWRELYHTGNFTPANYLPLTGGTITGALSVNEAVTINNANGRFFKSNRGSNSAELAISSSARAEVWASNGTAAQNRALGVTANGPPQFYDGGTWRDIWHASNQLSLGTTAASGRVALGLGSVATLNQSDVVLMTGSQTIAGNKTFSNNVIVIGTAFAGAGLVVQPVGAGPGQVNVNLLTYSTADTNTAIRFNGSNAAGGSHTAGTVRWDGPLTRFRLVNDSDSNIPIEASSFITASARRFKKDIEALPAAGQALDKLRAVAYRDAEDDKEQIGLIAEEVREIYPQVVALDFDGQCRGIDYAKLVAILIPEIQDLRKRVAVLEARPGRP